MNKDLQMELMKILYKQAFKPITMNQFKLLVDKYGYDSVVANLNFLIKTGVIEGCITKGSGNECCINLDSIIITAKGIDYLEPDSLGNDLNAITVKIHSSSLAKIEEIIKQSGLTEKEQKKLLDRIKDKGLDYFVTNLIDVAFSNLPTAYSLFKNLLSNMV